MIDYTPLFEALADTRLQPHLATIATRSTEKLDPARHGDIARWQAAIDSLPAVTPATVNLNSATVQIGSAGELDPGQHAALENALRQLHPWRKGPFQVFDTFIDTEWRSDWKWARLCNHIESLDGRLVLDAGCGNGYYAWRMVGAGARCVVGIDPTLLFVHQFAALYRYLGNTGAWVLPLAMEELPARTEAFDTVFSMGVLYHRRSPFDHLYELRDALRPGGELVLETLVIEGSGGEVLVPADRYARMRNVWFLPSAIELEAWLRRVGFVDIYVADVSVTRTDEQRSTGWMQFESLDQCLDPIDPSRTVEGYPAPRRAIVIARKPV